jgi:putative restriction endonuclease
MVDDYWQDTGRSGHRVWRYRLTKAVDRTTQPETVSEDPGTYSATERQEASVLRIVRDTAQARRVKALYDYRCQVCQTRLEGLAGPYAEAAHIRPLGAPHDGHDTLDNMLCLCPNHHVLFDHGGLAIEDDFSLTGGADRLTVHPRHRISQEYLRYRREHYPA